ncbi:MAG TPA: DUF1320 domain-containing protein [Sumerlaeia bacterium]|nr:DUF1320 domain-containing protein [Sumerlaeia bacterium]
MYASQSDIEDRLDPKHLIELADDDGDGTPDSAVIDAAIADADGLIDSYLNVRYDVPLATVPALVKKLSADLAVAALFARRREAASPTHEKRAREATALLLALGKGDVLLAGVSQGGAKGTPESTTKDDPKVFGRDSLEVY